MDRRVDIRYSTGASALDEALGGGLLPGTMTLVHGATGIGKTHLGVAFAAAGADQEGARGVFMDFTARGDTQDHAAYARRTAGWRLTDVSLDAVNIADLWKEGPGPADYVNLMTASGKRVIRDQVSAEDWHDWNAHIQAGFRRACLFLYASFLAGRRRVVADGLEPAERAADSAQREFFQYLSEQALMREPGLLARDALREKYFENEANVYERLYDHKEIATMVLVTSPETTLDDMLSRRLEAGDLAAVANTVILMGRVHEGERMGRALFIAKHRGSSCSDDIIPFRIGETGIEF